MESHKTCNPSVKSGLRTFMRASRLCTSNLSQRERNMQGIILMEDTALSFMN